MATYIILFRFTQQGIQNVKQSPARVQAAKQMLKAMGGEVQQFYMVLGQYDTVFVAEAPDDETIAQFCLALGAQGNVRTETLRAFTEDEFKRLVGALPER
ncbi:MAG: GYD domain-containing protein [Chloroflexi bacterium]|nr:GYD domain-containing protein [Chloroflexota bacterium]